MSKTVVSEIADRAAFFHLLAHNPGLIVLKLGAVDASPFVPDCPFGEAYPEFVASVAAADAYDSAIACENAIRVAQKLNTDDENRILQKESDNYAAEMRAQNLADIEYCDKHNLSKPAYISPVVVLTDDELQSNKNAASARAFVAFETACRKIVAVGLDEITTCSTFFSTYIAFANDTYAALESHHHQHL